MSRTEDTKAVAEAYTAALARRDVPALLDIVAPDVVGHEPAGAITGRPAFESAIAGWLDAFPDMRLVTRDLFAAGDRAAWRWSLAGVHATTGREVTTGGIIVFRVLAGRVAEYWGHYDRLGLRRQLEGDDDLVDGSPAATDLPPG